MTNRRVMLAASLLLPGFLVTVQLKLQGADEDKKAPDALQTMKAFLNFAFTGQAKAAAELGEPNQSYSREEKIKKEFERLDAKKPPTIVSFHADGGAALAITEPVVTKERGGKRQGGPLSIELVKKDNRWLIHDIDMGKDQADKNLKRFLVKHPQAKAVIKPKDK